MKLPSNNLNRIGLRATGAVWVRHPEGQFEAHFEDGYLAAQLGTGPAVETQQPVLTARTIDVQGLIKDTILDVDGVQYRFKRHEPDGTGMSIVYLRD